MLAFLPLSVAASSITPEKIVELVNQERAKNQLPALQINKALSQAAADKAADMVKYDYFEHTSPQGVTPWQWLEKNNYDYKYAGENLAMNFTTAESENKAWMDSPTHRDNILNTHYQEIGVAVREGRINGHTTILAVQEFGSRADFVPAQPPKAEPKSTEEPAAEKVQNPQKPQVLAENSLPGLARYLNALDKLAQNNLGVSASVVALSLIGYFTILNFIILAFLALEARKKLAQERYRLLYTVSFEDYLKSLQKNFTFDPSHFQVIQLQASKPKK